jgi:hypothetical protein
MIKNARTMALFTLTAAFCASIPLAGSNAAPIIVGTYYEDNASATCPSSSVCDVTFSRIPAGEPVLITHVSCHAEVVWAGATPGVLSLAKLGIKDRDGAIQFDREEFLARSTVSTINATNYYQLGNATSFLYTRRQFPYVRVHSVTSSFYIKCRIVGQRQAPT